MPRRFQLDGLTLEDVRARVAAEYGPRARIIAAERVITGGIGGFFGRQHFEATVEIPDTDPSEVPVFFDRASRIGIADLLADADAGDDVTGTTESLELSTSSPRFDVVLDEMTPRTVLALPTTPEPLRGAGDLLVVVGVRGDATTAAHALADMVGAAPTAVQEMSADGGGAARRGAVAARAEAVRAQRPAILAVPAGADVTSAAKLVRELGPDQVWLAVDASRKPEDTARWVDAVRARIQVAGVVAFGATVTSTPETVDELGLPVRWFEEKAE